MTPDGQTDGRRTARIVRQTQPADDAPDAQAADRTGSAVTEAMEIGLGATGFRHLAPALLEEVLPEEAVLECHQVHHQLGTRERAAG